MTRSMPSLSSTLCLLAIITSSFCLGCGGSNETTVIQPQKYELTDQEAQNRERELKELAEQRQE
jgi:hypothetical protein